MIFSRVRLGITIAVVLALGTTSYLLWDQIKEKAELAQKVVQQQATLSDMQETLAEERRLREKAEKIASLHKQKLDSIRAESRELRKGIRQLEKENEEVADWANSTIPGPIIGRLRDENGDKD